MKMALEKGTAIVETSISILTSISVVLFFFSLLYTAVARLWLDQITYDAVICLAESRSPSDCESQLKLKAHWVQARLEKIEFENQQRHWSIQAHWSLIKDIQLSTENRLFQKDLL